METEALPWVDELVQLHHHNATRAWYRLSWFGEHALRNTIQMREIAEHGIMAVALTSEPDPATALA
jgi:hypothetical protein